MDDGDMRDIRTKLNFCLFMVGLLLTLSCTALLIAMSVSEPVLHSLPKG